MDRLAQNPHAQRPATEERHAARVGGTDLARQSSAPLAPPLGAGRGRSERDHGGGRGRGEGGHEPGRSHGHETEGTGERFHAWRHSSLRLSRVAEADEGVQK